MKNVRFVRVVPFETMKIESAMRVKHFDKLHFMSRLEAERNHTKWLCDLAEERAAMFPESKWPALLAQRKGRLEGLQWATREAEEIMIASIDSTSVNKQSSVKQAIETAIRELREIPGDTDAMQENIHDVTDSIENALRALLKVYEGKARG